QAISILFVIAFSISQNNKEAPFTYRFLGTFPTLEGSGAHGHGGTLGFTLGKAEPPSGATTGETPERPQKVANVFSKYFRLDPKLLVSLEKTDARRKQLRYGAGRVVGPPTPPGYGTPLTTPTPKSLMNAKFLAEVYQIRIREHGSRVKKTRAQMHEASMGHTVDLTMTNSLIYKYNNDKY